MKIQAEPPTRPGQPPVDDRQPPMRDADVEMVDRFGSWNNANHQQTDAEIEHALDDCVRPGRAVARENLNMRTALSIECPFSGIERRIANWRVSHVNGLFPVHGPFDTHVDDVRQRLGRP